MKIAPTTIYIIGFSFGITVLSFGYFMHWQPNTEEANLYEENTQKLNEEAEKLPKAEKKYADAIAMVKVKASEWQGIAATRTPPASVRGGGINLAVNAFQLSEDTRKYRNSVQRAVNAQLRRGGIEVISGPYVPAPDPNAPATSLLASYYNLQALGYPAVIYDLGQVTVRGTYREISDHVRAYRTMPRYLAVADGLQINGTSPNLTATYNLTILGFLRAAVIHGQAPEGQAGSAAGGAPAGGPPGGGPPGRPGGPGAGGGPPGKPGGPSPGSMSIGGGAPSN